MKLFRNIKNRDILLMAGLILIPLLIFIKVKGLLLWIALMLAFIIPRYIYRNSSYYTTSGHIALCIAFFSMAIFFILNYWQSVMRLGTLDSPHLLNDARSFYEMSRDVANGTVGADSPVVSYMGYPLFLALWVKMGITDIAYPMIFNIFLLLCSMVLIARTVSFILPSNQEATKIGGYAMCLIAFIPSILATATIVSKEPFIIFGLVSAVCGLYALRDRYKCKKYGLLLAAGIIILATMRVTYLYVLFFFVAAVYLPRFKKEDIKPIVAIVVAIIAFIWIGSITMSYWGTNDFVKIYVHPRHSVEYIDGNSQLPYEYIIGPYHTYPLWLRLILLPICVAVQFMIPFPFETVAPQAGLPLSTWYVRQSYLWYAAAIPIAAYFVFYWFRKGGIRLSMFALAAAMAYCVPAFITGGTVSRYAFCFVPFLAIAGGYVINNFRFKQSEQKQLAIFALMYFMVVMIALFIGGHSYLILKYF